MTNTLGLPVEGYNTDNYSVVYELSRQSSSFEIMMLRFIFYIGDTDENGKEKTWLAMNYMTENDIRRGRPGRFCAFLESDFARLKEIFSESYLAEIDKVEAAWQQSHAE